ncbi:MAG TPA: hypothetical protein VFM48_07505 [Aquabacterium sp.]|nr:hypothetical protein [Aquabacterium sp.]
MAGARVLKGFWASGADVNNRGLSMQNQNGSPLGGGVWTLGCLMIITSLVLCGFWGKHGWPIGSFWWDDLALAGGAQAIDQGLRPTVDFWAPFIWPLYQKWLATKIAGLQGAYVVECVIQGWVIFGLFALAAWSRRLHWIVYVTVAILIVSAVSPFNILSVTEARLGEVSFDCSYNRLGGALIGLLVVWVGILRQDEIDVPRNKIWFALILTLSFLLKITVFQIVWGLIFMKSILEPGRGWFKLWFQSSIAAGVFLGLVFLMLGGVGGYWQALAHLSRVRAAVLDLRSMLELLIFIHRFELALYLLPALLVVCWGKLNARTQTAHVVWYLVVLLGFCLYTISNYGDNGLMPALAAVQVLMAGALVSSGSGERKVSGTPDSFHLLIRLTAACFGILSIFYLAFVFWWSAAYFDRSRQMPTGPVEFGGPVTTSAYQARMDSMTPVNLLTLDIPINVSDPRLFVQYLKELDGARRYLRAHWPETSTRVYALDFPAYAFSVLDKYRVPPKSYPWILFEHELNLDHYPDASDMLANVDVLLTSKCSLTGGNRKWLFSIFRVYIEKNFELSGSTSCWDIYSRRR